MKQKCSECGETHEVCPECESRFFTPNDAPNEPPVERFIHDTETGGSMTIREICWECGYSRTREITVNDINEN